MVFIVIVLHVLISAFLIWTGMSEKNKKIALVSQTLIAISLIYALNYILEWNLPGPGKAITYIFEPLSNLIFDTDYSYK